MSKSFNPEDENRPDDVAATGSPADLGQGAGAQSVETVEALRTQIEAKDREIAELNDKYLRALAEQENARKRIRQQAEESIRLQRESLLRDLLPIIDNLELAVAAARDGGNGNSIVEGIEMVLRSLHEMLRGHGVTPQQAVGRSFNPQFHEAVEHVESPEHQPNTVVREYHRGYQIGERVLRPARVAVAKAPTDHYKGHHEPHKHDRHGNGGGAGPVKSEPDDVENE